MMLIDPHAHMISRTTDDYEAMAAAGVVAVIEPAFWVGQPRTHVASYMDYLSAIVGFERFRAGQFGIRHYCTIGLNSKESNNEELAEAVMEILPRFALKEGVVAIGEIGYDEQTELEDRFFRLQLELAKELELPVMIHTPHRDKKRGTTRSMDVCEEHGMDPSMIVVDHNNEETVRECSIAATGLLFRSTLPLKWATPVWSIFSLNTDQSASWSIPLVTGVYQNHSALPKQRNWHLNEVFLQRM